jgi:hypothetical protein
MKRMYVTAEGMWGIITPKGFVVIDCENWSWRCRSKMLTLGPVLVMSIEGRLMANRFEADFLTNTLTDRESGSSQSYDSPKMTLLASVLFNAPT